MSNLFSSIAKPGTFLHDYMQYMGGLETPRSYDAWCGLWLISNAIGRRLVINRPQAPVYMNLYVVLCADAGTTRKSSAVRRCKAVYDAAALDEGVLSITGSITPEQMVSDLARQSAQYGRGYANICVSELVVFLGREAYTVAMPGLLTDLYDSPSRREQSRVGTGSTYVDNIYVTFLAASTPSWLVRAINPDVVEGGFTSRCLFIIEEKRKRLVAWPSTQNESDIIVGLSQSLRTIRDDATDLSSRGIDLHPSALTRFVRWYEQRDDRSNDPFTASFSAREDHHVLRLAGLLAANDRSWIIDVNHLEHAIKIIAHHKSTAAFMFGGQRESARLTEGIDKLRDVLREGGTAGVDQTTLVFKTRYKLKARELEYALALMHELEMVSLFEVPTRGRTKKVWRGTNKLLSRELGKLMQEKMGDE